MGSSSNNTSKNRHNPVETPSVRNILNGIHLLTEETTTNLGNIGRKRLDHLLESAPALLPVEVKGCVGELRRVNGGGDVFPRGIGRRVGDVGRHSAINEDGGCAHSWHDHGAAHVGGIPAGRGKTYVGGLPGKRVGAEIVGVTWSSALTGLPETGRAGMTHGKAPI